MQNKQLSLLDIRPICGLEITDLPQVRKPSAMTYLTRPIRSLETPLGATSLYHVVILSETLVSSIGSKWRSYKTRRALAALSDEQLADIGVRRADIASVSDLAD